MKNLFAALIVTVLGSSSLAATYYEGATYKGQECRVTLFDDTVSFQAEKVGFGFVASFKDIIAALKSGQNPVVIKGGDATISAKLTLAFKQDGTLDYAVYSQWNLIIPKRVTCYNLTKVQ